MIIVKNYKLQGNARIVLLSLLLLLASCHRLVVARIEGKQIPVSQQAGTNLPIATFIKPYQDTLARALNTALTYCPQTLDKSQGKWQSSLGNLLADICLAAADSVLWEQHQLKPDICLLNYGGIRAIIPQGIVTKRTAFELMPFENSLVVAALTGEEIKEIAAYLLADKKAHPIAGFSFVIDDDTIVDLRINGRPLQADATYLVATSDFLYSGGDNMVFFGKSKKMYDLNYKVRNVFIDYCKKVDTLVAITDNRISSKP